jgi:hypothetical protein
LIPGNCTTLTASREAAAMFLQRIGNSSLRPLWRLTNALIKVKNGALTQRDVKNEGTSGDVYENKGASDRITDN